MGAFIPPFCLAMALFVLFFCHSTIGDDSRCGFDLHSDLSHAVLSNMVRVPGVTHRRHSVLPPVYALLSRGMGYAASGRGSRVRTVLCAQLVSGLWLVMCVFIAGKKTCYVLCVFWIFIVRPGIFPGKIPGPPLSLGRLQKVFCKAVPHFGAADLVAPCGELLWALDKSQDGTFASGRFSAFHSCCSSIGLIFNA